MTSSSSPTSAGITVIGAAIIGLACALRLQHDGLKVALVDRDEPRHGASFGNAGHIATEQIYPLAAQLGYKVPLDTERGHHIALPQTKPAFNIPIASYERKVIMTPMSCGLRMIGTVEFGGLDLPPDVRRFGLLRKHMHALLPSADASTATTWMGFRPSLPDHLPVMGRAPDGREIYFAFGHQHLGVMLAGVTARMIAAAVRGHDKIESPSDFAVDRF